MLQHPLCTERDIDELIKRAHPFGVIDPGSYPSWTVASCIKYLLWFPIEFPLTLFMCISQTILHTYGWLKLKRTTNVKPASLNPSDSRDHDIDPKPSSAPELISIVISCFNELSNIELCLLYLQKYCHRPDRCEVILVDGGSTDGWVESLKNGLLNPQNGASPITIKTTIYPFADHQCSGRGVCQNIGVQKSRGNLLFFVHADTVLFDGYDEYIRSTLADDDRIVIGSFKFTVNRSLLDAPLVGLGWFHLNVAVHLLKRLWFGNANE